ncbi:MAG: hypothetical protein R3190_19510, partial [Thermoanaerobaculia bacterium]|nr:hypothetical protein [Thermoanaerobaculia bacterium]
ARRHRRLGLPQGGRSRVSGRDFELVPLDCPSCGAGVAAEGEDVVYYCTACRNGYVFDEAERSLERLEVGFVAAPNVAVERYLPFWRLPARVEVLDRKASGSAFSGLVGFFMGGSDRAPTPGEGDFAVPAFHCPLGELAALTRRYTERLPELDERLGERLTGGRYGVADARKLAHYALIAGEIGRSDVLTELRYRIDFGAPRLLGVPFVRHDGRLVDGVFGLGASAEP